MSLRDELEEYFAEHLDREDPEIDEVWAKWKAGYLTTDEAVEELERKGMWDVHWYPPTEGES